MRFNRFTCLSVLSNWGWYSPQELELLKIEDQVGKYLASLEDFVRSRGLVKNLIFEFQTIQNRSDVQESEYISVKTKLQQILNSVQQIRLEVLNQGGKIVPDSPLTFPNHKPEALIGEIRSYLERRKQNRLMGKDSSLTDFVIHHNPTTKASFDFIMNKGFKVLYTIDVDDHLSIGSGEHTKHSVVALGKTCKAAGTAQIEMDDRDDVYGTMKEREQQANDLEMRIQKEGDPKGELKENLLYYRQLVQTYALQLNGYVPPVLTSRVVLLDFDSGHYTPSKAWNEAMEAWKKAGYIPKWNPNSSRV